MHLMRVLLCNKIQCPSFICFCKPSPHIYAAAPLKLDNTPQVCDDDDDDDLDHYVDALVEEHVDGLLNDVREQEGGCAVEEKKEEEEEEGQSHGGILKSSLRKEVLDSEDGGERREKKVQWVDLIGKELAEIREFESSEEDIGYDGDKSCVCVIL